MAKIQIIVIMVTIFITILIVAKALYLVFKPAIAKHIETMANGIPIDQ